MVSAFKQFLEKYPSYVFDRGQTVLMKGDVPKGVYIIESGFIKTYSISENGDEQIISIDSKGEDIPIGYTLGLIERCRYFYEAYTRCVVRLVPRDDYLNHISTDQVSLLRRHTRITQLLLSNLSRIEALEQPKVADKVAHTLLYIADTIGGGASLPNRTVRRLSITQQEIANMLGVTRETAGGVLKKLELKKLLAHSRKTYVVYLEHLKRYIDK